MADLQQLLDHQLPRMAIQASGGSPGATLAGTLSTATHGGEWQWPLLVDRVKAVHLVAPGGVEWWIEGDEPIADPAHAADALPEPGPDARHPGGLVRHRRPDRTGRPRRGGRLDGDHGRHLLRRARGACRSSGCSRSWSRRTWSDLLTHRGGHRGPAARGDTDRQRASARRRPRRHAERHRDRQVGERLRRPGHQPGQPRLLDHQPPSQVPIPVDSNSPAATPDDYLTRLSASLTANAKDDFAGTGDRPGPGLPGLRHRRASTRSRTPAAPRGPLAGFLAELAGPLGRRRRGDERADGGQHRERPRRPRSRADVPRRRPHRVLQRAGGHRAGRGGRPHRRVVQGRARSAGPTRASPAAGSRWPWTSGGRSRSCRTRLFDGVLATTMVGQSKPMLGYISIRVCPHRPAR